MKVFILAALCLAGPLFALTKYSDYLLEHSAHAPRWMWDEIKACAFQQKGTPQRPARALLDTHLYVVIRKGRVKTQTLAHVRGMHHSSLRIQQAVAFLNRLSRSVDLPDAAFLLYLGDGVRYETEKTNLPILAYAKDRSATHTFLFPDYTATMGFWPVSTRMERNRHRFPWHQKKALAFWRGSTTGGDFNASNWTSFPRSKLVLLSLQWPELIDARFTTLVQGAEEVLPMQRQLSAYVQPEDALIYKYLVDVDGNTCTFPRLFWILASGSLLIKQDSPNVQWFYGAMKPYTHYVPCAQDLSDLAEKIRWAQGMDTLCEAISERAVQFAATHLQKEHTLLYVYLLIQHIATLQKK